MSGEWPKGLKKTAQREAVLAVLRAAPTPIAANEIAAKLSVGGESTWLSTIYRVLESFEAHGMVEHTMLESGSPALYALCRSEHMHYAVCIGCNEVTRIESCPLNAEIPELERERFQVAGHRLHVYGYCKNCR